MNLLLLFTACATVPSPAVETLHGTFEPRWWPLAPGYGASAADPYQTALVLRLDAPRDGVTDVIYAPHGVEDLVPDAAAMACVGGSAEVTGIYTAVLWRQAPAVLDRASTISCSPAVSRAPEYGETVTLSGTLRRWWWSLAPGYGADPRADKQAIGGVLLTEGGPVPLFSDGSETASERQRRFLAACDGQEVTVTGRWERAKNPAVKPPYKLVDVSYAAPCAAPTLADAPAPAGWLDPPPDTFSSPVSP